MVTSTTDLQLWTTLGKKNTKFAVEACRYATPAMITAGYSPTATSRFAAVTEKGEELHGSSVSS